MKGFKAVELFRYADKLQRLSGDVAHRKRRAAARIAIDLGQHHARERQGIAKGLRRVHGVLPLHGVHHEKCFDRLEQIVQCANFAHHRFVNAQATGRIDDQDVQMMALRKINGSARNIFRFLRWV